VTLLDATTVYPEILKAVLLGLFSTKLDLSVASLAASHAIHYVLESNFLVICHPGMRKDGIAGNVVATESSQAAAAVGVEFQKSHWCVEIGDPKSWEFSRDDDDMGQPP
jgi:hypothetical protein